MASSMATFMLTSAVLTSLAEASAFLGIQSQEVEAVTTQEVQQTLFSEFAALANSTVLDKIQAELRPLYVTMPKNENGKLEPSAVRYSLHRYFAKKRGWHVSGLDPRGNGWNSSSPASITKDRVPSYIQGLFEERVHGEGLGLEELAVFAATLADLIDKESVSDFKDIFGAMEYSSSASVRLSAASVDSLLRAFLVTYIKGIHHQANNSIDFKKMENELAQDCILWPDASMWVMDLRHTVELNQQSVRDPFLRQDLKNKPWGQISFNEAAEVALQVSHRFGSFQNMECASLKEQLVEMEDRGTGRVPLSKFYSGSAHKDWPFIESVRYLRNLGVLDESEPTRPRVVIPNYLGSRSNCVNPSSYYSVCCMNECEDLMSKVESAIAEPYARPVQLAEVISHLASDTVEAPRNLTQLQLTRLDNIAELHGGKVPLHGRLFAQWMHHAYPRECQFPHEAGTVNPLSQDEFMNEGFRVDASNEEIHRHTAMREAKHGIMTNDAKAESLPWTLTEELIATHKHGLEMGSSVSGVARLAAMCAAVTSLAVPVLRTSGFAQGFPIAGATKMERHLV